MSAGATMRGVQAWFRKSRASRKSEKNQRAAGVEQEISTASTRSLQPDSNEWPLLTCGAGSGLRCSF
jgi:hypothetical protein